jgi:hypothetical protein
MEVIPVEIASMAFASLTILAFAQGSAAASSGWTAGKVLPEDS